MHIVVATDSFKGSLSSLQAGAAIKEGIGQILPTASVTVRPLADGGEGTVEALADGAGGQLIQTVVTGPRLAPVRASYCRIGADTAVIEMAAAAGLPLLDPAQRDPMETTTLGVGELIRHAMESGCRHFVIGIGGSATNDGGTGMLRALGFDFLDGDGNPISLGAKGLEMLQQIRAEHALPLLKECTFHIACDVTNPLCGSLGCSAVFAPQKGAAQEDIPKMDRWLEHYAHLTRQFFPRADKDHPGAGAAGGLGFAFLAYLNATLGSGSRIVMELTGLEQYIAQADMVITGEGRLDAQSLMGKAPMAVAALAKQHNKPVFLFCGCAAEDAAVCLDHGIDAFFPITDRDPPESINLETKNAYNNLVRCVSRIFRQFQEERGCEYARV